LEDVPIGLVCIQVRVPGLPAFVESDPASLLAYLQGLAGTGQAVSALEQSSAARLLSKRITLYPDVRARLRRFVVEPSNALDSYLGLASPFEQSQWWTDRFVSACVGRETSTRSTPVRSTSDRQGICAEFPPAEHVTRWFLDLKLLRDNWSFGGISLAAVVYAYICLTHPYPDGNGRLARALALWSLRDHLSLPKLRVALGPSFTLARAHVVRELRRLSVTADWQRYIGFFNKLLWHAAISTAKLDKL
jgi:hypothetical protein